MGVPYPGSCLCESDYRAGDNHKGDQRVGDYRAGDNVVVTTA
jgi:hypothetical protein